MVSFPPCCLLLARWKHGFYSKAFMAQMTSAHDKELELREMMRQAGFSETVRTYKTEGRGLSSERADVCRSESPFRTSPAGVLRPSVSQGDQARRDRCVPRAYHGLAH